MNRYKRRKLVNKAGKYRRGYKDQMTSDTSSDDINSSQGGLLQIKMKTLVIITVVQAICLNMVQAVMQTLKQMYYR